MTRPRVACLTKMIKCIQYHGRESIALQGKDKEEYHFLELFSKLVMEDDEQVFSLNIQNELLALTECSDKTLNIFWK